MNNMVFIKVVLHGAEEEIIPKDEYIKLKECMINKGFTSTEGKFYNSQLNSYCIEDFTNNVLDYSVSVVSNVHFSNKVKGFSIIL